MIAMLKVNKNQTYGENNIMHVINVLKELENWLSLIYPFKICGTTPIPSLQTIKSVLALWSIDIFSFP